jgi:hypothetical protein
MKPAELRLCHVGRLWAFDLITPFRHLFLGGFESEAMARAVAERLALRLGRSLG